MRTITENVLILVGNIDKMSQSFKDAYHMQRDIIADDVALKHAQELLDRVQLTTKTACENVALAVSGSLKVNINTSETDFVVNLRTGIADFLEDDTLPQGPDNDRLFMQVKFHTDPDIIRSMLGISSFTPPAKGQDPDDAFQEYVFQWRGGEHDYDPHVSLGVFMLLALFETDYEWVGYDIHTPDAESPVFRALFSKNGLLAEIVFNYAVIQDTLTRINVIRADQMHSRTFNPIFSGL